MAEMAYRWECPLRRCPWVWMGPEDESFAVMQRGGQIRDHIDAHDPLEWVQELIDLRPVPIEVAPLQLGAPVIRRRSAASSDAYLADKLAEALASGDGHKLLVAAAAVEMALRMRAEEADEPESPARRIAVTREHLSRVALAYRDAVERGEAPTAAVAKVFQTSHSTATRWVGLARGAQLLGAARNGRAGEFGVIDG